MVYTTRRPSCEIRGFQMFPFEPSASGFLEEMLAVRQEEGEAVRRLPPRLVELRHGGDFASIGRDPGERLAEVWLEEDDPVPAPGPASRIGRVAERQRRSAGGFDLL